MEFDVKSMFESIKESIKDQKKSGGGNFKDILKMAPGNTYIVRLIPNMENPRNTFSHYRHHGWKSLATGQYLDCICLSTFEERCPICEERFKLSRSKKEEDTKIAELINRMEKRMVNVYVISDPTTPENNGTVKVLRYGAKIHAKIDGAISGDDADEFGPRIFDLSEKGCNFKIKVETTKDGMRQFQNYDQSRFCAPSAIEGMTPEKIKTIMESAIDLSKFVTPKSREEMVKLMETHVFLRGDVEKPVRETAKSTRDDDEDRDTPPVPKAKKAAPAPADDDDDQIPGAEVPKAKTEEEAPAAPKAGREKLTKLLNDLDGI